ncbi:MAG: S9 family peptidase [Candidatus Aminicenantes bacterium]|nr:S9 family peptidase [Candidatus Aminicenantes bacterium]
MAKKTITLLICALLVVSLQGLASKRALTFEDFIQIKRISDLQISPDGLQAAFVVTEMNRESNGSERNIWILFLADNSLRRLTSHQASDFNPRWSPDGKTIAFISTRSGSPQIWTIRPDGGEALQLTAYATGASGVIWSPDGKHLAFLSEIFPECKDLDESAKKLKEKEDNPVKAEIFSELLFRHWNAWREGKRSHLFVIPTEGGKAVDMTPGDFDTPPISLGGSQDYTFSPDGASICFVRNIDPELRTGRGTNNDLFVGPLEGGTIIQLTDNRANDNNPVYSPDGRYIAYHAMARPGFEADKYSLMLYDTKGRERKILTAGLDRSVEELVWKPDGSGLYFSCQSEGRMDIFFVPVENGKPQQILSGLTLGGIQLSPDGKRLYFLQQTLNRPSDLASFDFVSGRTEWLTDINRERLAELEMNPAEEFRFKGASGDSIHGFILKPPFFDSEKTYPLVMLIHGGPQGAWMDQFHFRWNAQMFAAPGYVVAMLNIHGSTGYGQAFTDSISGDWGGKPYRDIMTGLDYLLKEYPFIDGSRLAAAGASYGGYMINWLEGHTDRFNCLISHAGVFDLRSMYGATEELWFPEWEFRGTPWTSREQYERWSPSNFVSQFKTPCLVIHGQYDFRLPVTQGFQLFTSLQRMNVPSKLLYFPDEFHFINKPRNAELWWATVFEWLETYLKQPPVK